MKPYIKRINNKYYLFYVDTYGNVYDSMKHFRTWIEAFLVGVSI